MISIVNTISDDNYILLMESTHISLEKVSSMNIYVGMNIGENQLFKTCRRFQV